MAVTAITIENFKGIKDPVRIELKPITLLFGPNSAGKSTIVQALHYAHEIFERDNVDPDKTILGGDSIDLGGFQNLVHGQLKKEKEIKLGFTLDLSNEDLPDYKEGYEDLEHWMATDRDDDVEQDNIDFFMDVHNRVQTAEVTITVRWNEFLKKPSVVSYEVSINGKKLAKIEASSDSRQITLSYLGLYHPVFFTDEEWALYSTKIDKIKTDLEKNELEKIEGIIDVLASNDSGLISRLQYVLDDGAYNLFLMPSGKEPIALHNQISALPTWGKPITLDKNFWNEDSSYYEYGFFIKMISSLIIGPGEMIREALQKICYLGPLRKVPARNHWPDRSPDEARWASGLAAYDNLFFAEDDFIQKVNNWLTQEKRLHSGYGVEVKKYRELENDNPLTLAVLQGRILDDDEELRENLLNLPVKRRLLFRDEKMNLELAPQDIGVGISQVLPVVVAALNARTGFVVIEQPELHIHPAFQVALGDLFIEQIQEYPDLTFILETHSEHLMLRFLRRIREAHEQEAPENLTLVPNDLSIYFIEQGESGVSCQPIRVDDDGDFIDRWPKGFFNERVKELY